MDSAFAIDTGMNGQTEAGVSVTSPVALWERLCRLTDRQQACLSLCLESSTRGRGRRRRPTQERMVIAFRFGGRLRMFDPAATGGPLREVSGPHDLASYFDDVAGFSYVVVR